MLTATGIEVVFGSTRALAGVDLAVGDAEVVSVLGPSGCGKTTLLRTIAGLQVADAGSVAWDGTDLSGVPAHKRGFGLMFQDYALFPHKDVFNNVAFGLRMQRQPSDRIAARVREVLDLVGLAGYERCGVTQLSGGEQQRVALARAIAPAPRLLMFDEPVGSLDRTLRERLLVELRGLLGDLRIGALYVTHDQAEAFAIADRVIVMNEGTVVQEDTPEDLWARPANEFVARFLGLTNIVDECVKGSRRRVVIRPEAFEPDADGPIAGKVVDRTFRGDHFMLHVESGDAIYEMNARWTPLPDVGDHVRLRVRPDQVLVLEDKRRGSDPS